MARPADARPGAASPMGSGSPRPAGSYLLRLFFRLGVLVWALALYLRHREALDFTARPGLLSPTGALWLILLADFLLQLLPRGPVSRGCRKQFGCTWQAAEPPAGFSLPEKLKRLNRGAARVALVWILPNALFGLLFFCGALGPAEMLLLTVFYYLCDVICILLV